MIPDEMTAIAVEGGKGPPEALRPVRIKTPTPGPGQILIKVAAAGVNRPDVIQRLGFYPPPPGAPDTIGLEVAGEVAALGAGPARWKLGNSVTALLGGGGYAEYALVDARHALPVPKGMSLVEAAGLPETVFTVFANVFEGGRLKAGETLMVHGATSGIGVTAIQMGKAAGAVVIATGRGADKAAEALKLGADRAVDCEHGRLRRRRQGRGRRRRRARHGRRRLLRQEPRGAERRRADRDDRDAGRRHGRGQPRPDHAEARGPHRLDATPARRRREGPAGR